MNSKSKQVFLLILLVVCLIVINYNFLDKSLEGFFEESEMVFVERVIDGDTVVFNSSSIRLLGINSPERGEKYYEEAKNFLEKEVLNKTVELKFGNERYDKYDRLLAYVFVGQENVNLKLVEKGFANFYFPSGKDFYYDDFEKAWESCLNLNKNLCEKSQNICKDCIELKKFDFENEVLVFYNKCLYDCSLEGWEIKDEGRKNFVFHEFNLKTFSEVQVVVGNGIDNSTTLFWKGEDYVWTKTGDSLFLRDDEGGLVLWKGY
ncbi:MAG: thermonuclease family protein [Nanoarchaeota archaeon]|nr:thermonuclease family protein [Nanoarchaeota archaeon]